VLIAAVFLLFSVFGFYIDLMYGGVLPYAVVIQIALYSGLNAALWIIVLSRLPLSFLVGLIVLQFLHTWINSGIANWLIRTFDLKPVPAEWGIRFTATATMSTIVLSYIFFVVYIRREGRESFRMRNELELAHGIQKTLVPPMGLRTARFEIYGISCPSEKVGGDLVDAVCLPGGDAIAYVADIAGHGLSAGILMGMLKTATRTALLDADTAGIAGSLEQCAPGGERAAHVCDVHRLPAGSGRQRVLCAGGKPTHSAVACERADLVAHGGGPVSPRAAAGCRL
jgi:hypothetical protein